MGVGDPPREIDDGVAEAVRMINGENGLKVLQQELPDELLEKGFQPGSDCFSAP